MKGQYVILLVAAYFGSTYAISCFGTVCTISTQYCQISLKQHTGSCYTHHGQGHHEDHQKCVGAHHPGDHCFCLDQACVDEIARSFGITPQMDTTTMMAGTTMMPGTTMAPTTTTEGPTTALTIQILVCKGSPCIAPLKVCSIHFENGVPMSEMCDVPDSAKALCDVSQPSTGDCECRTTTCMDAINKLKKP